MREAATIALIATALAVSATGCHRQFDLELHSSPCLNPVDPPCDPRGQKSRVAYLNFYQLHTWIDPSALDYDDVVTSEAAFATLDPFLVEPARQKAMKTRFIVTPNERIPDDLVRLRRARYLLVVAEVSEPEERSTQAYRVGVFDKHQKLCIEDYKVWSPHSADDPCWFDYVDQGAPQ